jgi:hypothetical protein
MSRERNNLNQLAQSQRAKQAKFDRAAGARMSLDTDSIEPTLQAHESYLVAFPIQARLALATLFGVAGMLALHPESKDSTTPTAAAQTICRKAGLLLRGQYFVDGGGQKHPDGKNMYTDPAKDPTSKDQLIGPARGRSWEVYNPTTGRSKKVKLSDTTGQALASFENIPADSTAEAEINGQRISMPAVDLRVRNAPDDPAVLKLPNGMNLVDNNDGTNPSDVPCPPTGEAAIPVDMFDELTQPQAAQVTPGPTVSAGPIRLIRTPGPGTSATSTPDTGATVAATPATGATPGATRPAGATSAPAASTPGATGSPTPAGAGQPGQGPRGEQGQKGDPGPTGVPGPAGAPGKDGVDGAPGRDGVDGKDGVDGATGPEGPRGETENLRLWLLGLLGAGAVGGFVARALSRNAATNRELEADALHNTTINTALAPLQTEANTAAGRALAVRAEAAAAQAELAARQADAAAAATAATTPEIQTIANNQAQIAQLDADQAQRLADLADETAAGYSAAADQMRVGVRPVRTKRWRGIIGIGPRFN